MESCLFCKIANHELPAKMVHEDDRVIAFHDINPQAPVHVLVVPRKHIPTLNDVSADDAALLAHILAVASRIAEQMGVVLQQTASRCFTSICISSADEG